MTGTGFYTNIVSGNQCLSLFYKGGKVENKKIDVKFGLVVIAFLLVSIILIKEYKARRVNDYKEFAATITNIVRLKNDKIRILSYQLAVKQKENQELNNILSVTRNDLDTLTKKLAQQAPVAVPASAPAPAATTK